MEVAFKTSAGSKRTALTGTLSVGTLALAAVFGCNGPSHVSEHVANRPIPPAHQVQPPVYSHQGLSAGRELPAGTSQWSSQTIRQVSATELTDEQLLNAWDRFNDPRLHWVQRISLSNIDQSSQVDERLQAIGFPPLKTADFASARQKMAESLAHLVVDMRFHHHCLQTLIRELDEQEDVMDAARLRAQIGSGKGSDVDVLADEANITAEMQDAEREAINNFAKQLNVLAGQELTHALIDSIGDQPQLTIPGLVDKVPAENLRGRTDVDQATRELRSRGTQAGISEAQYYPLLALRGYIHARRNEPSSLPGYSPNIPGIPLDTLPESSFSNESFAPIVSGTSSQSPYQNSLVSYHQVVSHAATEVEDLLSDYHRKVAATRQLREQLAAQLDALRQAVINFEAGTASSATVAKQQRQLVDQYFQLHRQERQLGHIAIELFVAFGGPSRQDLIVPAALTSR